MKKDKLNNVESFVLKVSRILAMVIMLLVILALGINVLSYLYSKISPLFSQKYPKITFDVNEFRSSSSDGSGSTNIPGTISVDNSYSGKLADELLSKLENDYISTIDRLVRDKSVSLIRGQLSDEFRSLRQADLDEQLDAVIKDTAPKYWIIFKERSRPRIKKEIEYFSDENFQKDFAQKLATYLLDSHKNSVSPYSKFTYKGEEFDFITDIRDSQIFNLFSNRYKDERSRLENENRPEEFFTATRLGFIGASIFVLLFSGVLFSIMRIEKHLDKKQ